MSHTLLLDRLASAELDFAQFNAYRTSASPDATIRRDSTRHFLCVTDNSRPSNAYYNRAIANEVGKLHAGALEELPGRVVAVELRPTEVQPETVSRLIALGFQPSTSLCYLAALPPAQPLPVKQQVTRLDATQTDLFFDLLERSGTVFPPERRAAKKRFYCTEQFQAFVATDAQGNATGWSTLFLHEDFAFLGNSYTPPAMRGRGTHAALLAARLNAAAQAGVGNVFTDVEHGSQSLANCERAGLRTITINTIWERQT